MDYLAKIKEKDLLVFDFVSISLVHERKPFPTIYMVLDPPVLEVWCKVFILDSQIKEGLSLEDVKTMIGKVLTITDWKSERDITYRCWELYGITHLSKIANLKEFYYG